MAQLEKQTEMEILNFLKTLGIFAYKSERQGTFDPRRGVFRANHNPHKIRGVSDIIGICGGRFLAIEVKSAKGRISPEQRAFIARVNDEGGIAFVARSVEQVALSLAPHVPTHARLQTFAREFEARARKKLHQGVTHEEH